MAGFLRGPRRAPAALAIATCALAALALGACGGDDNARPSTGTATRPAAAPTVRASPPAAAPTAATGNADPLDKGYVAALCKAELNYARSVQKIQSDNPKLTDKAQAMVLLKPSLEQFLADLRAAVPPADARDYHQRSIAAFQAGLKTAEDTQDPNALNSVSFGTPPPGLGARLQISANANPDCANAGVRFDQ